MRILAVTSNSQLRHDLSQTFNAEPVDFCTDFPTARKKLVTEAYDLIVTEHRLGAFNGLHLAYLAKTAQPSARTVVCSATFDPVLAEEARAAAAVYGCGDRIVDAARTCLGATAA